MYPIIIALDPSEKIDNPLNWAMEIIDKTLDLVAGYKIGLPLLLRTCNIEKLLDKIPRDKLVIADLKLADIGDIMLLTIKNLAEKGFNAFIIHTFIGWDKGLETIAEYFKENNLKLITIVSMSHPGSRDLIDPNYEKLLELTIKSRAWGCIVGATKPHIIKKTKEHIRERNLDIKILSPGIGVQGAKPSSALKHGADYEIIGRMITMSKRPREKLVEAIKTYYGDSHE